MKNNKKLNLKDSYKTMEMLMKELTKDFVLVTDWQNKLLTVMPRDIEETEGFDERRTVFHISDNASLEKLDTDKLKQGILEKLRDRVNIDKLLNTFLGDLPSEDLLEVYNRAVVKKGKIKEVKGCYGFDIGGKPGHPFHIAIV